MVGPRLAALGLQATTVKEYVLYTALLQLTVERNLTASHLTLGLVAEMANLVFVRPKGGRSRMVTVPKDKISIKEFVHVVVFVAVRLGVEAVTAGLQCNIWVPKVLQKLVEELGEGELWPGLSHIPGVTIEKVKEERDKRLMQGEVEVQDIKCKGGSRRKRGAEGVESRDAKEPKIEEEEQEMVAEQKGEVKE